MKIDKIGQNIKDQLTQLIFGRTMKRTYLTRTYTSFVNSVSLMTGLNSCLDNKTDIGGNLRGAPGLEHPLGFCKEVLSTP